MVKLIALLEEGGRIEIPLRIRKFSNDCQKAAAISRRRKHHVQFVSREQLKGGKFPKSAASSNLARYEVHYLLVDLAFQLGHACGPCKKCANKEGRAALK